MATTLSLVMLACVARVTTSPC